MATFASPQSRGIGLLAGGADAWVLHELCSTKLTGTFLAPFCPSGSKQGEFP
jgi:hypothetical protein